MGYDFSETEKELINMLRNIIHDEDSFVGNMLALTVNQEDSDGNCRQLIDFLKENPKATYDDVMQKVDEILGIEDPFGDEE